MRLNYQQACEQAKRQSEDGCVRHVNAVIAKPLGLMADYDEPTIQGYVVSNWHDGSTVHSYVNGEEVS